jgi:superfamily II helicase
MNRRQKEANRMKLMAVTRIQQRKRKKKMEIRNRTKIIQSRQSHQRIISMSEPEGVRLQIATVLLKEYGLIKLCSVIYFWGRCDRFVLTFPFIFFAVLEWPG